MATDIQVSGLYVYPIKSLGGIAVNSATVTDRGFEHDRRWMLVDQDNRFLSQRGLPEMALLTVEIEANGLRIKHKMHPIDVFIPFLPDGEVCEVTVWDDTCTAVYVSREADNWFSHVLQTPCRLVYTPNDSRRMVDKKYARHDEVTSFSDGYPFLLISEASLYDLNSRLAQPLPMDRFRPNIVISGGTPYVEDIMAKFTIGGIHFSGVKLCARCVVTTTNQQTAARSAEPLKTLASYRRKNNKIFFGQNLLHNGIGQISVGDVVKNISLHTDERFLVSL